MIDKNQISHYLNKDNIRLTIADVTTATLTAAAKHNLTTSATIILGKLFAGTVVLATDFKNEEGISLLWKTNTSLGNIHVDAYGDHYLRGYIDHPEYAGTDNHILNKNGVLYVTRYSLLRTPYTSSIQLSSSDVSTCLTSYLNESDQTLSYLQVAVTRDKDNKIDRVFSLLAQLMPEGNPSKFNNYFSKPYSFVSVANSESYVSNTIDNLIYNGHFELIKKFRISFQCTCSEEKIINSVCSIPTYELEKISKEDTTVEVICQYCSTLYTIPIEKIIERKGKNEHE